MSLSDGGPGILCSSGLRAAHNLQKVEVIFGGLTAKPAQPCTAELCGSTGELGEGYGFLEYPKLRDMCSTEEPNSSGKQEEALHSRVLCWAIAVSNCPGAPVYYL